jgi:hypothetical protein
MMGSHTERRNGGVLKRHIGGLLKRHIGGVLKPGSCGYLCSARSRGVLISP